MNFYIDCGGWKADTFKKYLDEGYFVIVFEANSMYKSYYTEGKLTYHNKVLWTYDGEIDFYIGTMYDGLGSTVFKDKTTSNIKDVEPIKVPCIDFSKWILNNLNKDDCIILKMNIEGAEYPILNKMIEDGSINYIDKLIIAFHHHKIPSITKEEPDKLFAKLKKIGINTVIFGD